MLIFNVFRVSKTKYNILRTPCLENSAQFKKFPTQTMEIKYNYEKKVLKFCDSLTKALRFYSQLFPVVGDHSLHF